MILDLNASTLSVVQVPAHFNQPTILVLERQLEPLLRAQERVITLDFSKVSLVDSAALNWLLELQQRMAATMAQLQIRSPSVVMRDAFIATRLDSRLKIITESPAGGGA
jgi:anti-anti-sigma regulatory factor